MRSLALGSVKHSPGVTTAALALAAAWDTDAIVVEADPSGGDIAARTHLSLEPGLLTLAASARHAMSTLALDRHMQPLPAGGTAVVAPAAPELAAPAIAAIASRVCMAREASPLILDCGRLFVGSPALPAIAGSDAIVLLVEPTVSSVEHARARLGLLNEIGAPLVVVVVGDRPYEPDEVAAALGVRTAGHLAVDPRGVVELGRGRSARRSSLVRSARTVLDAIVTLTAESAIKEVPA